MNNKLFAFSFLFVFAFVSCEKNDDNLNFGEYEPGVALNFDDDFTKEWVSMYPILKKYNACATFNICPMFHFPAKDVESDLKFLYAKGNEIASHTMNHPNVVDYINKYGKESFIEKEILPCIKFFDNLHIPVRSFAYPGGVRNSSTDSVLLKYYDRVRGASQNKSDVENSSFVLYKGASVIYHFIYFDKKSPYSFDEIKGAILRAKAHNAVLILLGHRPAKIADTDYSFSLASLEEICSFVKQNKMKFYRMSDL